jgi:hypothetical protein
VRGAGSASAGELATAAIAVKSDEASGGDGSGGPPPLPHPRNRLVPFLNPQKFTQDFFMPNSLILLDKIIGSLNLGRKFTTERANFRENRRIGDASRGIRRA